MAWGALDRVIEARAVVRPQQDVEARYTLGQLTKLMSFEGNVYPFISTMGSSPYQDTERDEYSFTQFAQAVYKQNGIIFATILARMLLFTEARFQFQRMRNGRPGDMFGTQALETLETPWPNGTTGELLARMEQDVSLAGNFYVTKEAGRLRRLRPDWVDIILSAPPAQAVASDVVGYVYTPGGGASSGKDNRSPSKVFLPHEIAHWSPIPDPEALYRGMSWLTPVLSEIQADQATTQHKLKFFENAATPNLAVSFSENIGKAQFEAFMRAMNATHQGNSNAYKTLYLGGGADVKVIGADLRQLDFKATQGAGEALALDTPLPTPSGWTTMGEVQPGDQVVGRDGKPTTVLAVSPIHVNRDVYRVTFSDRTDIVADAAHIWQATDHGTSPRNERLYTTQQLAELVSRPYRNGGSGHGGGHRISVPLSPVVDLPNIELPLDPYFLGVWLGDGNSKDSTFSMGRHEFDHFEREFKSLGFHLHSRYQDKRCATDVVRFNHDEFVVRPVLRAMDLLNNKHIPNEYLRAGTAQRVELLRGLMDSDGYVDKRGRCEFSTKWAHLADQTAELLRSLGQRVTVSSKTEPRSITGETWRVTFRGDPCLIPFRMEHKAARVHSAGPGRVARRSIVSIERVDSVPVKCIAVDATDRLYLAGPGFVPTHNTRICAAGGVPPIIVGLSEGLQSATYSNYGMARRKFGDHWARPQWRSACAALSQLIDVPRNARLWYDDRDIAFLREDQKDVAAIQSQQAGTMKQLLDAGFTPESVQLAIINEDWTLLDHSGLYSVQLQPPGQLTPPGGAPADGTVPPPADGAAPAPDQQGAPAAGPQIPTAPAELPAGVETGSGPGGEFTADDVMKAAGIQQLSQQIQAQQRTIEKLIELVGRTIDPTEVDWDETEHPRGLDGKFSGKKGKGPGKGLPKLPDLTPTTDATVDTGQEDVKVRTPGDKSGRALGSGDMPHGQWTESLHPRDPSGKFGHKGGGSGRILDNPSVSDIAVGDLIYQPKKDRWVPVVENDGSGTIQVRLPNGALAPASVSRVPKVDKQGGAPAKPRAAHLDDIGRSLDRFKADGGTVRTDADPKEASDKLHKMSQYLLAFGLGGTPQEQDAFDNDEGVVFTDGSIGYGEQPGYRLITAEDGKLGLAGAMAVKDTTVDGNPALYVESVGSTGSTKGAGTALAKRAAELAAERNLPVYGDPADPGAEAFWRKVGWTKDPDGTGTPLFGWTADQAKEVASL